MFIGGCDRAARRSRQRPAQREIALAGGFAGDREAIRVAGRPEQAPRRVDSPMREGKSVANPLASVYPIASHEIGVRPNLFNKIAPTTSAISAARGSSACSRGRLRAGPDDEGAPLRVQRTA
jgi:hypothetical protein